MHMYTWRMTFLHEIVLVYVSHMKIWVQSFLHEIWNLHFPFVNLVVYSWSWYMVYGMLHTWMSVHTFSYMNMELCISHIGQFEHTFSSLKYGILYIFYMKISIKIFWHEVCSQWFKYESVMQIFTHEIETLYISKMKIKVHIILPEIWYILYFSQRYLGADFLDLHMQYSIISHMNIWVLFYLH